MSVAPTPSRELVEALRRIQQPRPLPRWRRLLRRIRLQRLFDERGEAVLL